MRKFHKVTNCQTGSSELVLADGHTDALSFYRKKNNVERSVTLSVCDQYAYDLTDRFNTTKLSELPDGSYFYKVIKGTYECAYPMLQKSARMANGMVKCYDASDDNAATKYLKGSTMVAYVVDS